MIFVQLYNTCDLSQINLDSLADTADMVSVIFLNILNIFGQDLRIFFSISGINYNLQSSVL